MREHLEEEPDRVRSAADTRHRDVGLAPGLLPKLRERFAPDHRLEVADDHRVRMRAEHRAEDVVRRRDVRHPVADSLVDRVFERLRPARHRHDLRAEEAHPEDVELLARHVDLAHVDDALQAQQSAGRRRGDAVLARARLGDDSPLAHPPGEQRLA